MNDSLQTALVVLVYAVIALTVSGVVVSVWWFRKVRKMQDKMIDNHNEHWKRPF